MQERSYRSRNSRYRADAGGDVERYCSFAVCERLYIVEEGLGRTRMFLNDDNVRDDATAIELQAHWITNDVSRVHLLALVATM